MDRRILVVLRHAKSDWSGNEPDHRRPLAPRGRRQAPEAGAWLASHVDRLDLAVVSTAVRARQTWELAAAELVDAPPVVLEEGAYAASGSALLALVRDLGAEAHAVVIVGHNPGVEELVAELTGGWVTMPTSALAVIEVDGAWSRAGAGSGRLAAHGRPPRD